MEQAENHAPENQGKRRRPRRRISLSVAVFLSVLLLALVLHRCEREPPPLPLPPLAPQGQGSPAVPPETLSLPTPVKPHRVRPAPDTAKPKAAVAAPADSAPYIYADPWGGRHFDSVRVSLHCREGCVVLYSLEDSIHFKSYQDTFTFRRNTTLWISGIDSLRRQVEPIRIEYVIERNPGACSDNSMPLNLKGRTVCVDVYEWPDREGEFPRAFVSQKEAEDSCRSAGKRLCALEEWQGACRGPDGEAYPYAGKYNENHCPAKEPAASRSGRFPACRSYYGNYDMTGNVWEWTSTPAADQPEFFMVAGGNWSGGNQATCGLAKFSFYPQNRYPFVGFRCCRDAKSP